MDVFEISRDRLFLMSCAHVLAQSHDGSFVAPLDMHATADAMVAEGWLERHERTPGERGRYRLAPAYAEFAESCHKIRRDTIIAAGRWDAEMPASVPLPGRGTVGRHWTIA